MPTPYAKIKERRENDPEYAARLKSYAEKYRVENRDKERERQRLEKARLRERDREGYNAKMREYNKEKVYPQKAEQTLDRKKKNPEYHERLSTKSQLSQTDYWRHWKMKKSYGIGIFEYREMYADQQGKCAICGDERPDHGANGMVVDHCHAHGHVRKLLCPPCNKGLGHFRDNVQILAKAIDYLQSNIKD